MGASGSSTNQMLVAGQINRLDGDFKPIGDQHSLHQRLVHVLEHDLHLTIANMGLSRITEQRRIDLSQELLGSLHNLHATLMKAFLTPMKFGGVDDGVKSEMIDCRRVIDRLDSKVSDFDCGGLRADQAGNSASDVTDDRRVHDNHDENQGCTPVTT